MSRNNIFGKISLSLLIIVIVTICITVSGCEEKKEYQRFTEYDYEHLYETVTKWEKHFSDAIDDLDDFDDCLDKMNGKKLGNLPEFKELYDELYPIFYKMAHIDERKLNWEQENLLHPLVVISEKGLEFLDTVKTKRDNKEAAGLYENFEFDLEYFYNKFNKNYNKNILIYGKKYVTDEEWLNAIEEYKEDWNEYAKNHPDDNKSNNKSYSSSKSKSKDPYDVDEFEHAEDFYEFHYDDFIDYEEAEDYYNEHKDD